MKTEHNGAKHGKGFWGRKQEAKEFSKKARRNQGKYLTRNWQNYMEEDDEQVSQRYN